jgi:hypothetical protein
MNIELTGAAGHFEEPEAPRGRMMAHMTTWADGGGQAFKDLDEATAGVGAKLPGQHAITPAERAKYNTDHNDYSYHTGTDLIAKSGGRLQGVTTEMHSAHKIGQASSDDLWGEKQEYLRAAQQTPLGDVNDPAARLKAMSFITQDKPLKPGETASEVSLDKSACSGASIVGAAFLADGPEGLKKVMQALEAQDPKGELTGKKNASPEYTKLKEKLAKDPSSLTVTDIQALQLATTEVLSKNQRADKTLDLKEGETGIHGQTMDNFMKKSPELAKMFEKNGMQIEGIDNDGAIDDQGKTGMDHWVVRMKDPSGKEAIYDPNARRGGQVIDFDEGVKHYENARQDIVGQP